MVETLIGNDVIAHPERATDVLPPWVTGLARNTEKIVDFMEISNK